jgi:hypothetical protein
LFIYNVWLWREKRDEKNRRRSKRRDEKVLIRKRRELWRGKVSCCLLVFVAKFQVAKQARFCCCVVQKLRIYAHTTQVTTPSQRDVISHSGCCIFCFYFLSFRILFLNRSIILHFPFFILTLLFK